MSEYRRYKKWLKHTLPRIEEWSESDADDNGRCPLGQDEVSWILGLIKDLESEREALNLDNKRLYEDRYLLTSRSAKYRALLMECKSIIKVLDRKREHPALDAVIERVEGALTEFEEGK